jgi:NADH-quinone oxidoreductase subunit N
MNFSLFQPEDLLRIAPELVLCGFGIVIMLAEPFVAKARKRMLGWLGFVGTIAAAGSMWYPAHHLGLAYQGLVRVDQFSLFFHGIVIGSAALAILGSLQYLDYEQLPFGEYCALVLFATAGMGILAGAEELVVAFLGLEMSSISSYILAGFLRHSLKSNESSLKYFLLGSFATAFFLYGIAMVYGATGTTRITQVQAVVATSPMNALLVLGLGMMFVGLGFKVVAAPFQIYAPDVYEGAPTPVTGLLASAPKAAAFALLLRIFYVGFSPMGHLWFWVIWISAALSMCIGNFGALAQSNIKRMLAYSSIAHAGYILVGFAASTWIGIASVLFYLVAYALVTVGAFTLVAHLGGVNERRLEIPDFAGLGRKQPAVAACFTIFLLSLLGLPATGGFMGKFYVFQAGISPHDPRLLWLVILASLNSVLGAYYYLRVVVAMYFSEPQDDWTPAPVAPSVGVVLFVATIGTLYLGLFPSRVMAYAVQSALSLR